MLLSGMGAPLGVPPAPEDPLMARVAPEACVFYTTWAGTTEPDPDSPNQTEQLLAEPEIQELFAQIGRIFDKGLSERTGGQGGGAAQAIIDDVAPLAKKLTTRPGVLFVSRAEMSHTGPDVRGGLVICLNDDAPLAKQLLEKYQKAFLGEKVEPLEIDGVSCFQINPGRGAPAVTWNVKGRYLIVGVGEGEMEGIFERARTGPPRWLTELREKLAVQRPATFTYVNIKTLLDTLVPLAGGPQARKAAEASGFGQVTSLAAVTGLDKDGFVGRSMLGLDGEPSGLISLLAGKPLGPADLAPIPADATVALAFRADADRILETFLSVVSEGEPRAGKEMLKNIGELEEALGISLPGDLLTPLGDVWCVYNSPGEGGLLITGLTAVVRVDDHTRLAQTQSKLVGFVRGLFRPRIEECEFAGQRVYFVNARQNKFPLAPAWCLTENELIVATLPQNVKAYLSRTDGHRPLATAPTVAELFESGDGPVAVSYINTPRLFELLYPLVPMVAQSAMSQLPRQGIDINVSILPSAPAIGRHLRPGVAALRRTDSGFEVINRQSLPGGSIGVAVPIAAGVLLPALSSARRAARRVSSASNLKHISLSLHNYHSVHKTLPPAYTTDKDGKPLLSWRVRILPYLEQNALYERFHQDEPWDSEHNKKLIPLMPKTLKAPGSKAGPGKTNYLAVRGDKTVFAGAKGIGFSDIRDGTSNTIMTVEASDESAVVWTKPDDFQYDPKNPIKGLLGPRTRGFNAGFADGSVRFISGTVSPDALKAAFTRDGGEGIDQQDFNPPSRRTRTRDIPGTQ